MEIYRLKPHISSFRGSPLHLTEARPKKTRLAQFQLQAENGQEAYDKGDASFPADADVLTFSSSITRMKRTRKTPMRRQRRHWQILSHTHLDRSTSSKSNNLHLSGPDRGNCFRELTELVLLSLNESPCSIICEKTELFCISVLLSTVYPIAEAYICFGKQKISTG
jgi:hypothetical protein